MNRLPSKFEVEVLSKHDIKWSQDRYYHVEELYGVRAGGPGVYTEQSEYAIVGIALEVLTKLDVSTGIVKRTNEYGLIRYKEPHIYVKDEDFCTCVFKAVEEIWK